MPRAVSFRQPRFFQLCMRSYKRPPYSVKWKHVTDASWLRLAASSNATAFCSSFHHLA